MAKGRILITCSKGIAPFLAGEVRSLGLPVSGESVAGVETEGDMADAMMLNLYIRTGHRVLFLLSEFNADDAGDLYREILGLPWEQIIPAGGYLSVTSSTATPAIKDSRFANQRCKDAIVDRIRGAAGRRPDAGPLRDRAVVFLYWKGSRASIYIDTSGEPLSRRGYRKSALAAPLQETLAAAIVLASGWQGTGNFINPMCGSGTLAIEAALIAISRAPGILRENFGFMHLKGFIPQAWGALKDKALSTERIRLQCRIIATDIDPGAVAAARRNASLAGVGGLIEFHVSDFADTPIPEGGGVVVLNPEYGERMGRVPELEKTYRRVGDFLKQRCSGLQGHVFTGSSTLSKQIGLRPKRRLPFYNGAIECRLLSYDLYEGSTRQKPSPAPLRD